MVSSKGPKDKITCKESFVDLCQSLLICRLRFLTLLLLVLNFFNMCCCFNCYLVLIFTWFNVGEKHRFPSSVSSFCFRRLQLGNIILKISFVTLQIFRQLIVILPVWPSTMFKQTYAKIQDNICTVITCFNCLLKYNLMRMSRLSAFLFIVKFPSFKLIQCLNKSI